MQTDFKSQELELDSNYNTNNSDNSTSSLYICRRVRVLKETDKRPEKWKNYLKMRSLLLKQHCGSTISSTVENRGLSKIFSKMTLSNGLRNNDVPSEKPIVATKEANASRALVGGNSIIENYSFIGVHHIFDQHKGSITMVKFANNDCSKLCCASIDGSLSVCDVASDPPSVLIMLKGHEKSVTGFDWSANNDLIVSTSLDGTVRIWNVETLTCLSVIKDSDHVQTLCCLFQPINNNVLIIGNNMGELRVVNISTGRYMKESCKIGGNVLSLASDTYGSLIWSGNDRGEIVAVKGGMDGKLFKTKRLTIQTSCSITSLSYRVWISREARDPMLLVNSANNSLCLLSIINTDGELALKRKFKINQEKYSIKSTFCPLMSFRQGACIVTGSEDGNVYFLDVEKATSKACINTLQGHSKPVTGVSFNYNESLLATGDSDGLIILWKRTRVSQINREA